MAKAKTTSLLDDVLARSLRSKPGFACWFERLPADAQAELDAARQAFDPRQHQKKAYALAIIDAATERGWPICGEQGVISWLNARR